MGRHQGISASPEFLLNCLSARGQQNENRQGPNRVSACVTRGAAEAYAHAHKVTHAQVGPRPTPCLPPCMHTDVHTQALVVVVAVDVAVVMVTVAAVVNVVAVVVDLCQHLLWSLIIVMCYDEQIWAAE